MRNGNRGVVTGKRRGDASDTSDGSDEGKTTPMRGDQVNSMAAKETMEAVSRVADWP